MLLERLPSAIFLYYLAVTSKRAGVLTLWNRDALLRAIRLQFVLRKFRPDVLDQLCREIENENDEETLVFC